MTREELEAKIAAIDGHWRNVPEPVNDLIVAARSLWEENARLKAACDLWVPKDCVGSASMPKDSP